MKEILWTLFNKTGDIRYYNLLVKLRSDENENRKYSRNNTNGD